MGRLLVREVVRDRGAEGHGPLGEGSTSLRRPGAPRGLAPTSVIGGGAGPHPSHFFPVRVSFPPPEWSSVRRRPMSQWHSWAIYRKVPSSSWRGLWAARVPHPMDEGPQLGQTWGVGDKRVVLRASQKLRQGPLVWGGVGATQAPFSNLNEVPHPEFPTFSHVQHPLGPTVNPLHPREKMVKKHQHKIV